MQLLIAFIYNYICCSHYLSNGLTKKKIIRVANNNGARSTILHQSRYSLNPLYLQVNGNMMDRSNYEAVAALDIGTTNSECTYSSKSSFEKNPRDIDCYLYCDGRNWVCKISTCVLLDKNKKLLSIGCEAENSFEELYFDKGKDEYFFFKGFTTEKVF